VSADHFINILTTMIEDGLYRIDEEDKRSGDNTVKSRIMPIVIVRRH
jgi:hypothetical protein